VEILVGIQVLTTFLFRRMPWTGALALATVLAGCSGTFPLMPTPVLYAGDKGRPLFHRVPPDRRVPSLDLLYVTDRAPSTKPDDPRPYSADRSRSMAFGSVTVDFGENVTWDELVRLSTVS